MGYILAFMFRPLRTLYLCWRYCTLRGDRCIIYMKSGNKIEVDVKTITMNRGSNTYMTGAEWEHPGLPTRQLLSFDVDQVEAVVVKRG